ncbi:MAG: sulfatase-like hydrolase/transferase, partial [Planctomycetaceae bacterium]|nr:sulfatase-like hydrolase/transferase [Planctomycetaceae bacterium]
MQAIDDVLVRRHTGETDRRQLTERMLAAWLCLCSFSLSMFSDVTAAEVGSPNILFILADDLAWADPHCYGHPWHATPNIDRLASLGMRFTQAYAPAPICSASRAAILTGKTPARLNFEFVTRDKPGDQEIDAPTLLRAPPLTLNLPAAEVTMAEVLRDCGYQTAFFGKWHVSAHHQRYLGWSPTHGPRQQGFEVAEEDFGSHPYSWGKTPPETINEAGWFPEDSMVRRVTEFLQREHDRPWFVMASQFYVHTPVKTPCHWLLEKYEQLIPAGTPSRKQRIAYAAFVETLDHYVGRIIDAVPSEDRANTVIVFTSDNGGHPEYAANGPLRGSKWNLYEGGIRVPLVVRWPHGFQGGSVCHGPVTGCDLMPTFAALA